MNKIEHVFIDFDGVMTDNRVYVFEDGREAVCCSRADGIGLQMLKDLDIGVTILSTETNPVVSERAKKLDVDCIQGCEDKGRFMFLLGESGKLDLSKVAYIGNDVNDLEAMKQVGYPIAVADAHGDIIDFLKPGERNPDFGYVEEQEPVIYVLRNRAWITKVRGGHGAVREACERIVNVYCK